CVCSVYGRMAQRMRFVPSPEGERGTRPQAKDYGQLVTRHPGFLAARGHFGRAISRREPAGENPPLEPLYYLAHALPGSYYRGRLRPAAGPLSERWSDSARSRARVQIGLAPDAAQICGKRRAGGAIPPGSGWSGSVAGGAHGTVDGFVGAG